MEVLEVLKFLLENSYIEFDKALYKQTVGIPMGANYVPMLADLFLYSYESEFMMKLAKSGDQDLIEKFNNSFRYIDDVLSMDNPFFVQKIKTIYPSQLQLNKSNSSSVEASFLDLHLEVTDGIIKVNVYDKRDDFNFKIINFPCLDGDVPMSPSYGVYISQLVRFSRICTDVKDFSLRSTIMTSKLLAQGFTYHKLRRSFIKFYNKHLSKITKYNTSLKFLITTSISHPDFYGDALKKLRKLHKIHDGTQAGRIGSLFESFINRGYLRGILFNTFCLSFPKEYLLQQVGISY